MLYLASCVLGAGVVWLIFFKEQAYLASFILVNALDLFSNHTRKLYFILASFPSSCGFKTRVAIWPGYNHPGGFILYKSFPCSQDICYRIALLELVVVAALRAYTKCRLNTPPYDTKHMTE